MKKFLNPLILSAFAVLSITACDVVEAPYEEKPVVPIDDTTTAIVLQNVLLEDYTGHTCGRCPEAADIAKNIQNTYGKNRVVVVAVHAGPFARIDEEYPTDFRTPEGTELDNSFAISRAGNPNGMVNRLKANGKFVRGKDEWAPFTSNILPQKARLKMEASVVWDSVARTAKAVVVMDFLEASTPDYQIVGLLIEDNIISDQLDYRFTPSHIKDYKFEHVLRASLNGTYGDVLSSTAIPKGTKKTVEFTYTIPEDRIWKPEDCNLVFYVHKHNTTREVVQVVQVKLIP